VVISPRRVDAKPEVTAIVGMFVVEEILAAERIHDRDFAGRGEVLQL
jgi:hypothetical protein